VEGIMLEREEMSIPSYRTMLFQLLAAEMLAGHELELALSRQTGSHSLLLFTDLPVVLSREGQEAPACQVYCRLLKPGQTLPSSSRKEPSSACIRLTFHVIQSGDGEHPLRHYTGGLLSGQQELKVYPVSRLLRMVRQLLAYDAIQEETEGLKRNLLFVELMVFVLEQNLQSGLGAGPAGAVKESVRYIQEHYMESITVRGLAEQAQVPPWQYTAIFKELTGMKPLDYLTELRIDHAKEWLAASPVPLRDVARNAGFADEYYFSRRFRQATGMTPRQYSNAMRKRVHVRDWTGHTVSIPANPRRIIYYGEAMGDLLTLGIHPIGSSTAELADTLLADSAGEVEDIGFPLNPDKAAALEPDLIIFSNSNEQQYRQLSRIAPTITYNSWGSLEERMKMLGQWFGKGAEADRWLTAYRQDWQHMWEELQPYVQEGETASVFVYHRGRKLFVMGGIGLPAVLYHPSGFRPSREIEQQLLKKDLAYKEIKEPSLSSYAGDRIFMIMPQDPVSRQAAEELMNSILWRNLPAVQEGRAYLVEEKKWNLSDAFSSGQLLTMLPGLLKSGLEAASPLK
jgi:AraC family transcriptional regulator, transcriptional activator for feuABC-ybbA operon